MEPGSIVVVNLQSPREKILGILMSISPSGMTVRGIEVESFREWMNQWSHAELDATIHPSTVFYPMHRVLNCYLDESSGPVPSFSSQFKARSGKDLSTELHGSAEKPS